MNAKIDNGAGKWVSLIAFLMAFGVNATLARAQRAVLKTPLVVYQQPNPSSGVVSRVAAGDTIEVVARDGAWVQVKVPEGLYGWFPLETRSKAREPQTNGRDNGHLRTTETKKTNESPGQTDTPARSADVPQRVPIRPARPAMSGFRQTAFSFEMGVFEGEFTYHLRLVRDHSTKIGWEGRFGHVVDSEGSSFLLSAGIVYKVFPNSPVRPYLIGGFGLVNTVPKQIETAQSTSHFAVNYGFEVQWPISSGFALQSEFRQHAVFVGGTNVNRQAITFGIVLGRFFR